MADPRDIWVGDWKAKFYETNRAFNGAGRMDDLEKKKWDTYYSVGHNIYKQIHPTSYIASDIISASSYYANLAILRDRQAVKDQATASSSASAGAAAAAAARAQKEYEEKQKALAERQKQIDASIASSSASAGKAAAAAAKYESAEGSAAKIADAQRAEKLREGKRLDDLTRSQSEAAGKTAGQAAKREAEYKKKLKADAAAEDLAVKNANLEALIKQQQGTIDALQQQAASGGTVYYSASSDNGASMDNNNLTLEPVAVQGTNLRNSLLLVGGVALVWWFFKKKKKRAR